MFSQHNDKMKDLLRPAFAEFLGEPFESFFVTVFAGLPFEVLSCMKSSSIGCLLIPEHRIIARSRVSRGVMNRFLFFLQARRSSSMSLAGAPSTPQQTSKHPCDWPVELFQPSFVCSG